VLSFGTGLSWVNIWKISIYIYTCREAGIPGFEFLVGALDGVSILLPRLKISTIEKKKDKKKKEQRTFQFDPQQNLQEKEI
jgi:hypothetical protein